MLSQVQRSYYLPYDDLFDGAALFLRESLACAPLLLNVLFYR